MSLKRIHVVRTTGGALYAGARAAVFGPLLGLKGSLAHRRSLWKKCYSDLDIRWRHALMRWHAERLSVAALAEDARNMTACPPFGAIVENGREGRYPCHKQSLCPYCWSRAYVLGPASRIRRAFMRRGDGSSSRTWSAKKTGLRLVEFERFMDFPHDGRHLLENAMTSARTWIRSPDRRSLPHDLLAPVLGGYVLHAIHRLRDGIRCRRSSLLVVEGAPGRTVGDSSSSFRDLGPLTIRSLAAAAGRTGRYPSGWWRAPTWEVELYLFALRRLRMLSVFGAPKKKRKRRSSKLGE